VVEMSRKTAKILLISVIMIMGVFQVTAQSIGDGSDISISKDSETFDCDPGDIPSTSIVDQTKKDITKIVDPGSYEERYPDKCRSWTKEYVIDEGEKKLTYVLEVMKYSGDNWEAVVKVERNGEPVTYADVDLEDADTGATDYQGMMRTELPEDGFRIEVSTADGDLHLEGER